MISHRATKRFPAISFGRHDTPPGRKPSRRRRLGHTAARRVRRGRGKPGGHSALSVHRRTGRIVCNPGLGDCDRHVRIATIESTATFMLTEIPHPCLEPLIDGKVTLARGTCSYLVRSQSGAGGLARRDPGSLGFDADTAQNGSMPPSTGRSSTKRCLARSSWSAGVG